MPSDKITYLSPDLLQPSPLQPRSEIAKEPMQNLINSIKRNGILEPLLVAKTPAGYQIISGERRWKAAKILRLNSVPVVIKEMKPKEMLQMALVENLQRENLTPIDRARSFVRLKEEFDVSWAKIAESIGKSVPYVVNTVRLLSLPDAVKDGLLSGLITEGHARALASITEPRAVIEAYKIVLKEKASVRRTEEIVRRMKKNIKETNATDLQGGGVVRYELLKTDKDQIAQQIKRSLADYDIDVIITQSRKRAEIKIRSEGDFSKTGSFIAELARRISGGQS
jgi:ParB family chromosome partitioning protein